MIPTSHIIVQVQDLVLRVGSEIVIESNDHQRITHVDILFEAGDHSLDLRRLKVGIVVFKISECLGEFLFEIRSITEYTMCLHQQRVDVWVGEIAKTFVDECCIGRKIGASQEQFMNICMPRKETLQLFFCCDCRKGIFEGLPLKVYLYVFGIGSECTLPVVIVIASNEARKSK